MARHRFVEIRSQISHLEKIRSMQLGEQAESGKQAAFRSGCRCHAPVVAGKAGCAPPGFNADL
jgi:hypothetical protein